jgi:hypothetical protein
MNRKIILLATTIALGTWYGCKKDEVAQQENNNALYPRIFNETPFFPVPTTITTIKVTSDTIKYRGITFSPASEVKVSWKVNNIEVATTPTFNFSSTTAGDFFIKVEASYNGQVTSRTREVLVK